MRLLDLFCGAGGAAMGYHRAGFEVVGVDIKPQPNYPFEFHQADAMEWLQGEVGPNYLLRDAFDVVHASPPCQAYSEGGRRYPDRQALHPRLIAPVREALMALGVPYVIENVMGALPEMRSPLMLHGGLFGLEVVRARLFESNVLLMAGRDAKPTKAVGVYGERPDGRILNSKYPRIRAASSIDEARAAMGIDWMTWPEITQAIPPAYTEWIGRQLLRLS